MKNQEVKIATEIQIVKNGGIIRKTIGTKDSLQLTVDYFNKVAKELQNGVDKIEVVLVPIMGTYLK